MCYTVTDLPAAYLETYEFLAIGRVSFYLVAESRRNAKM